MESLPTWACPLSLKRTISTVARVTASLTDMLATTKQIFTWVLTPKNPIPTIPLLLHLTALATIHPTCLARRARAVVTDFCALVDFTV